ncbi:hypothetical protein ACLMJK_008350 [Lecanora helva]
MVKPLAFKGENKKPKKRKQPHPEIDTQIGFVSEGTPIPKTTAEVEQDDSWVTAELATDITGPVIFALPLTKPACLACDANGKVFASELENIVDGDLTTAEPHDIRQVWIASQVAGTDDISFKGHHGRCDKVGVLSATREAISPEESFLCIPSPETSQTFNIRTVRGKFLTIDDESKTLGIRGDADSISFSTTLRIRMQARFKPSLKANKESKIKGKVSRQELEEAVGRKLGEDEIKRLKKARIQGDYHEAILDVKVKGKHDKYS